MMLPNETRVAEYIERHALCVRSLSQLSPQAFPKALAKLILLAIVQVVEVIHNLLPQIQMESAANVPAAPTHYRSELSIRHDIGMMVDCVSHMEVDYLGGIHRSPRHVLRGILA
ncbi:hypothetical protein [Cupriavidus basilensis]